MQLVLDAVLEGGPVLPRQAALGQDLPHNPSGVLDDVLVLPHIDEAAADDVRAGHQTALVPVDGHHHDDQAVLAQVLAVAQHHVAHIAHAQAVHQHRAGGNLLAQVAALAVHLDHLPDLRDDDVLAGHAHGFGQLRVLPEHAVFAVDGDEILRLHQRVNQLQLLLAGVAGNVHLRHGLVHHLRAAAVQLVDDPGDEFLIAWDGVGGHDDHVALADLQLAVLGVGHAGQARHGLALAAGGHHQDLLVRVLVEAVHVDDALLGDVQLADLHGHPAHVDHAPPDEAHPPAVADGVVNDHLHAVDVAGEHGHDHTALGVPKQVLEGGADLDLAHGVAGALHVGGLAQQGQHALLAQGGEGSQIRHMPVDGGVVNLEVAADHHGARRAGDGNGAGACDGVAHMDEAAGELAQLDFIPGLYHMQGDVGDAVLLELQVHQGQRQLGAVQGRGHLAQNIRRCADMILMPVGEQVAADVLLLGHQIAHIGDHQINAQHILLGEDAAAVHHNDIVLVFEDRHVLADFIHAAQGDDAQLTGIGVVRGSRAHRKPPFLSLRIWVCTKQASGNPPGAISNRTHAGLSTVCAGALLRREARSCATPDAPACTGRERRSSQPIAVCRAFRPAIPLVLILYHRRRKSTSKSPPKFCRKSDKILVDIGVSVRICYFRLIRRADNSPSAPQPRPSPGARRLRPHGPHGRSTRRSLPFRAPSGRGW